MKYLDMVISETLRKWSPAPAIDRLSVKDYTFEPNCPDETSFTSAKGSHIWIPVFAIHRDPKNYPDPEKFDPERFNDINKHKIKPFTYLPFGSGPRNCIASRFALLEAKIVLVEILRNSEILQIEKTEIPLKIDNTNFALKSRNGIWLGLKKRFFTN